MVAVPGEISSLDDEEEKPVVTAEVTPSVPVAESPPAPAASPVLPAPATPSREPMTFDDMIVTPEKAQALNARLLELKRQQAAQSGAVNDETVRRLRADRAEVERAFRATELDPNDLQPWDQKAKQNEYRTDPVEAFGSIGSVFAMLATSFAGLPMEYALNAGAAAIQAVHAGDEKAYNRDFEAWKTNTDLALKRHNIVRQHYNDAILKMNTNLNAGRSELEMAARKFGDQQAIAMLEAGLDKDLNDLIAGRNKSALELQSTADQVWLQHEKTMDLKNDPRWLSGNPALKQQAVQEWQERWRAGGRSQLSYDFKKDYIEARKREKPDYVPDDLLRWGQEATEAETKTKPVGIGPAQAAEIERRAADYESQGMPRADAFDRATREVKAAATIQRPLPFDSEKEFFDAKKREKPEYTSEDYAAWQREWIAAQDAKAGAPEKLTGPQEKARRIKAYEDEIRAAEPNLTDTQVYEKAQARYNQANLSISGNRSDDIRRQISMYENGITAIDKSVKVLDNYVGAPGAAGYARRAAERVSNIFGSNKTDLNQFAHEIRYLQSIAPRLLNDSSGRPLSAEAKKIDNIVAGLNLGDTTANTKRALLEIRELWAKMQNDNRDRLKLPATSVPGSNEAPKDGTGANEPAWKRAPRSSLDSPVMSDADPEGIVPGAQYAMMPPTVVSRPTMIRPTLADRLDHGFGALDDTNEYLEPRMGRSMRRMAPRTSGGPR